MLRIRLSRFPGTFTACTEVIQRPFAGAYDQEKKQAEDHGPVRARFVHHCPESFLREHGNFRCDDCHTYCDDQRNGGETHDHPEQDHSPADDLDAANKWGKHLGKGNTDLDEPADAQSIWK